MHRRPTCRPARQYPRLTQRRHSPASRVTARRPHSGQASAPSGPASPASTSRALTSVATASPASQSTAGRRRGQARRRDPALAAPWERAVASILDWALILAASLAIFLGPLLSARPADAGHPDPVPGPEPDRGADGDEQPQPGSVNPQHGPAHAARGFRHRPGLLLDRARRPGAPPWASGPSACASSPSASTPGSASGRPAFGP